MSGRAIVREIRSSESFCALSYRQRDLWQGIIEVADDQGRLRGTAALVRSAVWPSDNISLEDVQADLDVLAGGSDPFIKIYQVDGKTYVQVINWWKYQKMQWAAASNYPAPEGWTDRVQINVKGGHIFSQNWDKAGGFTETDSQVSSKVDTHLDTCIDTQPDSQINKINVKQNQTKLNKEKPKSEISCDESLFVSEQKPAEIQIVWNYAIGELQRQMGRADFEAWVKPAKLSGFSGDVVQVEVINFYARDWLKARSIGKVLSDQISAALHRPVSVEFFVKSPEPVQALDSS